MTDRADEDETVPVGWAGNSGPFIDYSLEDSGTMPRSATATLYAVTLVPQKIWDDYNAAEAEYRRCLSALEAHIFGQRTPNRR